MIDGASADDLLAHRDECGELVEQRARGRSAAPRKPGALQGLQVAVRGRAVQAEPLGDERGREACGCPGRAARGRRPPGRSTGSAPAVGVGAVGPAGVIPAIASLMSLTSSSRVELLMSISTAGVCSQCNHVIPHHEQADRVAQSLIAQLVLDNAIDVSVI